MRLSAATVLSFKVTWCSYPYFQNNLASVDGIRGASTKGAEEELLPGNEAHARVNHELAQYIYRHSGAEDEKNTVSWVDCNRPTRIRRRTGFCSWNRFRIYGNIERFPWTQVSVHGILERFPWKVSMHRNKYLSQSPFPVTKQVPFPFLTGKGYQDVIALSNINYTHQHSQLSSLPRGKTR